jgi:hypothetical protein
VKRQTSQPLERALHPCQMRPISRPVPHVVLVAEGLRSGQHALQHECLLVHSMYNLTYDLVDRIHNIQAPCSAQEDLYLRAPSSTSEDSRLCVSSSATMYVQQCANGMCPHSQFAIYESLPEALKHPCILENDTLGAANLLFARQPKGHNRTF